MKCRLTNDHEARKSGVARYLVVWKKDESEGNLGWFIAKCCLQTDCLVGSGVLLWHCYVIILLKIGPLKINFHTSFLFHHFFKRPFYSNFSFFSTLSLRSGKGPFPLVCAYVQQQRHKSIEIERHQKMERKKVKLNLSTSDVFSFFRRCSKFDLAFDLFLRETTSLPDLRENGFNKKFRLRNFRRKLGNL